MRAPEHQHCFIPRCTAQARGRGHAGHPRVRRSRAPSVPRPTDPPCRPHDGPRAHYRAREYEPSNPAEAGSHMKNDVVLEICGFGVGTVGSGFDTVGSGFSRIAIGGNEQSRVRQLWDPASAGFGLASITAGPGFSRIGIRVHPGCVGSRRHRDGGQWRQSSAAGFGTPRQFRSTGYPLSTQSVAKFVGSTSTCTFVKPISRSAVNAGVTFGQCSMGQHPQ